MDLQLKGKRALVTGSSSGIGEAIAAALAAEGAAVVVHGRNEERTRRAVAGTGITINTVSPGPVRTPAAERVLRGIAKDQGWGTDDWAEIERRAVKEVVPTSVGRIGRVEEVAYAVAFLASPLADFIDG